MILCRNHNSKANINSYSWWLNANVASSPDFKEFFWVPISRGAGFLVKNMNIYMVYTWYILPKYDQYRRLIEGSLYR
jgi:hypothetical protein